MSAGLERRVRRQLGGTAGGAPGAVTAELGKGRGVGRYGAAVYGGCDYQGGIGKYGVVRYDMGAVYGPEAARDRTARYGEGFYGRRGVYG